MIYQVGTKVITKKPHACGFKEWLIVRTGADIKLKCQNCGRVVFVSVDQLRIMAKKFINQDDGEAVK